MEGEKRMWDEYGWEKGKRGLILQIEQKGWK
jgi:hypothetical protein